MEMRSASNIKTSVLLAACAAGLALAPSAQAIVGFTWQTVGNPGNPADTQVMDKGPAADFTTGYGAVGYAYRISKYHVTNTQYTAFLNAVDPNGANALKLYDTRMGVNPYNPSTLIGGLAYQGGIDLNAAAPAGARYSVKSGQANYPATWIYFDAGCRFVNWLSNGQGSGGTETGVYTMPPLTSSAVPTRNAGASIFIPSEDEFYKAAYYDPTKNGTGGYWQFGERTDTAPVSEAPPGGPHSANMPIELTAAYNGAKTYWQNGSTFHYDTNYLTDVGAYSNATSYYGVSDASNVIFNWTEGIKTLGSTNFPVYRGGAWYYGTNYSGARLRNLYSFANVASYAWFGLRLAAYGLDGDANMDGTVNTLDFNALVGHFGQHGAVWSEGDFDHSGAVNTIDFNVLAGNFGNTLPVAGSNLGAFVPEPAGLAMGISSIATMGICRARSKHVRKDQADRKI
jgi:formylglycine-generating enzyme required for sulfatase activity